MILICTTCSKEFSTDNRKRKYCSVACFNKAPAWNRGLKGMNGDHNKHNIFQPCEVCGTEYRITQARVGKSRFCSDECRIKWLAVNRSKMVGTAAPAYKYGHKHTYYRKAAFEIHGENCNRCGCTDELEVHHKDKNRMNNPSDGSNWEVLCQKCHKEHHKPTTVRKYYRKSYEHTCVRCDVIFSSLSKIQKYCSTKCYRSQ